MPKINVYLPDELAEAVRDTGVPVSAICQGALEQAVRRVAAIRQSSRGEVTPASLDDQFPLFTGRARRVVAMAIDRARAASAPNVGSGDLLGAMLDEGHGLAVQVLQSIGIEPTQVARELSRQSATEANTPDAKTPQHFSRPAAAALELTVTEATSLGANYVGTEHLLLGFVNETDGIAGQVLRSLGAEARLARRAVSAALAGYLHLHNQNSDSKQFLAAALQPLLDRIERLERRLDETSKPN